MYQFQFERTFEDYKVLSRVSAKTVYKKSVLYRILYGVYAVCFLALATANFYLQRWVLVVFFVSAGLFFAIWTIFWHSYIAWRMQRRAPKDLGIITVQLEETGVREKHAKVEAFSPYEAYDGVYYCRERYFLTANREVGGLPESALVEGDPATLKAFLEEKLHKEVKEIP